MYIYNFCSSKGIGKPPKYSTLVNFPCKVALLVVRNPRKNVGLMFVCIQYDSNIYTGGMRQQNVQNSMCLSKSSSRRSRLKSNVTCRELT